MEVAYRRPITFEELDHMFTSGVFHPDESIELIDGELFVKPPDTRRHRATLNRLNRIFTARFNFRAVVQIDQSVVLEKYSAPKPDLALLVEDPTCYEGRNPGPSDMLLAIEVGDSSRRFDREKKLPLYAKHKVAELWLIDCVEQTLTTYREPVERWYAKSAIFSRRDIVACGAFPNDAIAVSDILSPE
jgi:Uma2 family endonuclease